MRKRIEEWLIPIIICLFALFIISSIMLGSMDKREYGNKVCDEMGGTFIYHDNMNEHCLRDGVDLFNE